MSDLKRLPADEAYRLVNEQGYTILDVRSMPEYGEEHASGAYNVPFLHKAPMGMIPNADFSRIVQAVFPDKSRKLITSCQMGGRSVRAAMELKNLGYTQVIDLRGGFGGERDEAGNLVVPGWKERGLPTEKGEPAERAYKHLNAFVNQAGHAAAASSSASADPNAAGCAPAIVEAPLPPNRFADPARTVMCVKFGRLMPALRRKPIPGPLGERISKGVSAEGWRMWVEHSKMLINEYRMNPADAKAQEMLLEQCEKFFFGEGASLPPGFVPAAQPSK